ncbi:MAG: hypothetical protein KIS92_17510 [Planctomycetota bacterium]|nr:hypothetical protein [Planctomycetota bacterium]
MAESARQSLLHSLWICGDSRVELFAPDQHPRMGDPLWAWDANGSPDLDAERRAWFQHMDDVKPVATSGDDCVLVTSSGAGGVALIRLDDKHVLFSAPLKNAHSAELLPGGWIAAAGSTGSDVLRLYHLEDGETPRHEVPLEHGHGAVFDARRGLLWICGSDHVFAYKWETARALKAWERVHAIELPETGAHDMLPDPHHGGLVITTGSRVWRLDPQTQVLAPFVPLERVPEVKSVSVEARSGYIAFTKGEGGHWWSENVYVLTPDARLQVRQLRGRRLYKVRWDQPCSL